MMKPVSSYSPVFFHESLLMGRKKHKLKIIFAIDVRNFNIIVDGIIPTSLRSVVTNRSGQFLTILIDILAIGLVPFTT